MISAYGSVINYQNDDWEEYLKMLNLFNIFEKVIVAYGEDKNTLRGVIRYIVWAYSISSDKIIWEEDWQKNKEHIFNLCGFTETVKDKIWGNIVLLFDEAVVTTIHRWLHFQDEEVFTQLQVLKDLKVEMQLSAISAIKKSSDEVDYDQKFKNVGYARDLRVMIKDLEAELIQNDSRVKEAVKELRTQTKPQKSTIGAEKFAVN